MNLFGKVIERGEGYRVIRFPFWCSEAALMRAAVKIMREEQAVRITVDERLMRIER